MSIVRKTYGLELLKKEVPRFGKKKGKSLMIWNLDTGKTVVQSTLTEKECGRDL